MAQQNTVNIDQSLNELDKLSRSAISDNEFLQRLLRHLSGIIGSTSNAVVIPALESRWIIRSAVGSIDQNILNAFREIRLENAENPNDDVSYSGSAPGFVWYAVPVSNVSLSQGLLVSVYPVALSDAEQKGLHEIQRAYCELISERQSISFEKFFTRDMSTVREMGHCFDTNDNTTSAAQTLVNGLASMISFCRVSLSEGDPNGQCTPLAVSSVSAIDTKSPDYHKIRSLALKTLEEQATVVSRTNHSSDSQAQSTAANECDTIFLPFGDLSHAPQWVLGFEFSDHGAMVSGCSKLPYVLPVIETLWKQKQRWLDMPEWIRNVPFSKSMLRSNKSRRIRRASVCLLVLAFLVWMILPAPLLIEAEGSLTPSESKAIFASADGFISTLLVSDNQSIEAGQLLATMTSPELEIQLEDLRGKVRGFEEESRGLEIAINQLQPNADDSLKQQSFIASKLKELAIQIESLRTQIQIIDKQRETLEIRSPISGIAIGKDLQQNLLGRPVNRGELLFRVMDVDSDWELRVNVSDYDSEYVRNAFEHAADKDTPPIEFVLDNSPQERHKASFLSISNRVENIHREGNFLEVRAHGFELSPQQKKVGSNVHAYFHCGDRSTWFVWFRPLIEAAHRKLWL